jgi:hypothetical protein
VKEKNHPVYFTVRLPYWVGLSDQLCHLVRLYLIGRALSFTYVHTPLAFPRSYNKSFSEKTVDYIKYIFNKIQRRKKFYGDGLARFCGLDHHELNISDDQFKGYRKVQVHLDKYFSETDVCDIASLQAYISSLRSYSEPVIFSLNTAGIYAFNAKIDYLLASANIKEEFVLEQLKLAENYWKTRQKKPIRIPFATDKIKIAIHIRRGDTACFTLGGKIISVFSETVKIVDNMADIQDPARKPIEAEVFYRLLQNIFSQYGEENFSVIVLSDGYERAFKAISAAINQGIISISHTDLASIKTQISSEFALFNKHSNVSLIIGESRAKLFKSIHAIVSADILIMSTGGFAYFPHIFFKKASQRTICLHARNAQDNCKQPIENIKALFHDRLKLNSNT